ncbi:MAG: tetratricopeptide repeat protein [Burkholderiales bacterium]|nr:tetratricopeptide repeat protein [Burkholderiales bacterium]
MNRQPRMHNGALRRLAAAASFAAISQSVLANDAEVVLLIGKAEVQTGAQGQWQPATLQQKLAAGTSIRTSGASQVAVVLRDQTQVRLNEQSMLRIAAVNAEGEGTNVELARGRMWAQAKQWVTGVLRSVSGSIVAVNRAARPGLRVSTPTATVGIRGTDWELVVEDDRTVVTVLSGEVLLANAQGEVAVGANEQGTAERGKAPVKTLLSSARDRVQWVTAYRPTPGRWVPSPPPALAGAVKAIESGDYAGALPVLERAAPSSAEAALLLADMRLFQGRAADAIALVQPLARDGAGNPMATALLMRALVIAGRLDDARALAARAGSQPGAAREVTLARADVARIAGEAELALRLFNEVAAAYPQSHEAWFGVGRIENEKEDVKKARAALDEALRLAAGGPGYLGERATVESLAGELKAARALFEAALARQPDDYLALTGLGILELKAGNSDRALEAFLKAGVIEPRFARAQLYSGVTYYRQGNRERALEAIRRAAELDPRDPLPHVMLGLIRGDALELGAAVDAAREAQARMPFLKSLNQILNDQKGSANLGSSLSNFGMEEWASFYANEAYSPYWAGSHLFLADRHTGQFNKNSELFKGFITDPTVFGASNRFSSLVQVPGHYGRVDLFYERNNFDQGAVIGTFNGLSTERMPLAYYFSGDLSTGKSRDDPTTASGGNLTLGFGARPRHDLGIFVFGTDNDIRSNLRSPSLPTDNLVQKEQRADVGVNFKFSPTNQVWLKVGDGRQTNAVDGAIVSASAATSLDRAAAPFRFPATGSLDRFRSAVTQQDLQFRHAFTAGDWLLSWGLERSNQDLGGDLSTTFTGVFGAFRAPTTITTSDTYIVRATDAYLGARFKASERLELEGQVSDQRGTTRRVGNNSLNINIIGVPPPIFVPVSAGHAERSHDDTNLRLGMKWRLGERQTLRLVGQQWRRPAGAATLAPLDTLGIAVNDRLPVAGGLYQRTRLQYDGELSASTFVQAFADEERVDNGLGGARSAITDFQLTQLQNLRNRQDVFTPKSDLERTPVFAVGTVRTVGMAINHRLSSRQTLSLRYLNRDSRQSGGANEGLVVPYTPRHYLLAGSQWALPGRWLVGTNAAYRSIRFRDDTNQNAAQHGWSYGLTVYWEGEDKRSSFQAILDNLLSRSNAGDTSDAHLVLRYGYRF